MRQIQPRFTGFIRQMPRQCTSQNRCARSILPCHGAVPKHAAIPHELPLFPVQPVGVFLPGMTKTLHLYEPHFISLMEECLASEHKFMATAVLEPFMGEASEVDAGPGAFVGGYNFSLSCGCLVQVLSTKPYTGGFLVRIRGEARLGISGLPQTGPYMRAQVYSLPDQPAAPEPDQMAHLQDKVTQLQSIMRDIQNLASKFRCDETAALQQAMRWLHSAPVTPGIQPTPVALTSVAPEPPPLTPGDPGTLSGQNDLVDGRGGCSSMGDEDDDDSAGCTGSAAAAAAALLLPSLAAGSVSPVDGDRVSTAGCGGSGDDDGGGFGGGGCALSKARVEVQQMLPLAAADADGGTEEETEEAFDLEEAVRLSWASLQWLPHASTEERMYLVRTRLLAMDTRDVGRRLELALEAMDRARASLAAKCAIKAM